MMRKITKKPSKAPIALSLKGIEKPNNESISPSPKPGNVSILGKILCSKSIKAKINSKEKKKRADSKIRKRFKQKKK